VLAVIVSGTAAAYLMLVSSGERGIIGPIVPGLVASYRTLEVNVVGSAVAAAFAAWTATRAWRGGGGAIAGVLTAVLAATAYAMQWPVLPLWFGWAALKCASRGRWTLAALVAASALVPLPNPTGSPTYGIFAVLTSAFASARDEPSVDGVLHWLGPRFAAGIVVALLLTAIAIRAGLPVPVLSRLAQPLQAEGERTRQFEVLVANVLDSPWRASPGRFVRSAQSPAEGDAIDRRFRPPTNDHFLATWLDWRRGAPPTVDDTLWFGFGGDAPAGMDTLFVARGRHAGDALVLRRSFAALPVDSVTAQP
jgi:hypothetical protein